MRVWTYVIVADLGSAPNHEGAATTLTICKPRIRRSARPGDLVIAFNGAAVEDEEGCFRHAHPDSLRWAGVVADVLPLAAYWSDPRFAGKRPGASTRPDNFYRDDGHGLTWVENTVHGPDHHARDTGGRQALVFDRRWRFGRTAPILPPAFGLAQRARRGERLHDLPESGGAAVIAWLDAQPQPELRASRRTRSASCSPRRSTPHRGGC